MKDLTLILLTPTLWVAWALLFASNTTDNPWRMVLICIFTLVPFMIMYFITPYPALSEVGMTQGEITKIILGGILNGIGLILYAILLKNPDKAPLNGAAINFLMPILFIIGGIIFFKIKIDTVQFIGIIGVFISLCLVKYKEIIELLQKFQN